jgi:hypothetical protein
MHDPADQHSADQPQHDDKRGAAPGDPLLDGVVLDGHAEVQLDADDPDSGGAAEHRRDADALESHSEQAADETRGAVPHDRDKPVDR